ncbi:hypothetical protein ZWY2020_003090 [Hordeum vulgare]|nr:hypothetical protein ZWY2020_003090 [Hordeum vulgare]
MEQSQDGGGVKVKFIETQFVSSDAANFKSVAAAHRQVLQDAAAAIRAQASPKALQQSRQAKAPMRLRQRPADGCRAGQANGGGLRADARGRAERALRLCRPALRHPERAAPRRERRKWLSLLMHAWPEEESCCPSPFCGGSRAYLLEGCHCHGSTGPRNPFSQMLTGSARCDLPQAQVEVRAK